LFNCVINCIIICFPRQDAPDRKKHRKSMDTHVVPEDRRKRRGIGSLEVGMGLLSVLAEAGGAMKLKDIAAAAGMPAAKAHRYLSSFLETGMVAQDGRSGRYDLGPFAARLGVAALARHDVIERAAGRLATLRDAIRETCFVSFWSDGGPIVIRWEDSLRPVTVNVRVGSPMPLLRSATGRLFLAYIPRSQLSRLLDAEMAATGTTPQAVDDLIGRTRTRGLGRIKGELQADVDALAAPLFDPIGQMVGSVTALGRAGTFDASETGTVADSLRAFSKKVST
jgi:DNA-binding IclR family transcriptional regulator